MRLLRLLRLLLLVPSHGFRPAKFSFLEVSLVPAPAELRVHAGQLRLGPLAAAAPPRLLAVLAQFLGRYDTAEPWLVARLSTSVGHAEGYLLNVTDQVLIEAATEHGLFNGLMTLRQLLQRNEGGWTMPRVEIVDEPAFPWRGLMLDVSRHFFPASAVKRLLQTMALFKMNHFHWHLTDDQGWRFPVAKYPKLISLGAARRGTELGQSSKTDGVAYNHSYSEEEIKEILNLAESLYIEVLPEFDLPGHSQAAVASYPELGNVGDEVEVATNFGAQPYTLAPVERSVNFTKDVLSEMALLFPRSAYIHIGGDEVSTAQWAKSSEALAVAKAKDLDLQHLEGMMLQEAAGHLQSLHKGAVVWDDAMESGPLPKGTVVMLWRSWLGLEKLGEKAEALGHQVVLAPQAYTYLDQWPDKAHDSYLPLSKVYATPTAAGGAEVLGLQGQLWSEHISEQNLDYMAWPRGCALAEVAWSKVRPGYPDFRKRLLQRAPDLKLFNQNFRMNLQEV